MDSAIYELKVDLRYVWLTFADDENFVFRPGGRFLAEGLVKALQKIAPSFEVVVCDEDVNLKTVKFPDLASFLPGFCCFSLNGWSKIEAELNVKGAVVKLAHTQDGRMVEFVLFEPDGWFECLDFERSKVQYFDTPPFRVKWVDSLVLKNVPETVEDIFRVDHLPTQLFCTEKCVQVVRKHRLTGFKFSRVPMSD